MATQKEQKSSLFDQLSGVLLRTSTASRSVVFSPTLPGKMT